MRQPRALVTRIRALMGIHRFIDVSRRVDELATAAAENARLEALLEDRVGELERTVAEVASRRLPREAAAPGDSI